MNEPEIQYTEEKSRLSEKPFSPDDEIEVENTDYDSENGEEIVDSIMEEPFNPSEISILSRADTMHNLIERLKHEEIDMNSDFQRHADLWDNKKMSRLIESILIRFPLPAFYFDASNDDKWLIVDGLQRLSAIRKYIIDKKMQLRGLEYLKDLNGKRYDQLPRQHKRRIDECSVTLFLIQSGTPDPVKYSIFRRINTGGLVLNDQEIRNAMTTPDVRKILEELAQDEHLKKTMGDQSRRMVDQELVLRYLAFKFMDFEKSKKNITSFLDEMVEKMEGSTLEEFEEYRCSFKLAIKRSWDIFGKSAFEKRGRKQNSRRIRKSSTLFEVWTNVLVNLTEEKMAALCGKKEELVKRHIDLITDDTDYFRSITWSTQKRDHYRTRREKVSQIIEEVLDA